MGFVIAIVAVGAFVYGFRKMWRFTLPEASRARRVERARVRHQIERQARDE